MGTYRGGAAMTQIQMAEWEWPDEVRHLICTPLSHAGAAFFVPRCCRAARSWCCPASTRRRCSRPSRSTGSRRSCSCPRCSTCCSTTRASTTTDLSSLETVYYGAAAMSPTRLKEAIERFGPIFFQFYGQAECPMTITVLRKDEHDLDDLGPPRLVRPAGAVGARRAARRRRQRGAGGRARRDLRAGPAGDGRLLEQAGADRRGLRGGWLHTGDVAREDDGGLPHHRRPQEGHDRLRRVQHVPPRGRGRAGHPPRGRRGRGRSACRTTSGARR